MKIWGLKDHSFPALTDFSLNFRLLDNQYSDDACSGSSSPMFEILSVLFLVAYNGTLLVLWIRCYFFGPGVQLIMDPAGRIRIQPGHFCGY